MTTVTYVTLKQMAERTGMPTALGYSFPNRDEILIRKGLPKKVEAKVRAHEADHIAKGEEGPFLGAIIAGSLLSGLFGKKASDKQAQAADTASAESRRQFDIARGDALPYISTGQSALAKLAKLYGLQGSAPAAPATFPAGYTLPPWTFTPGQGLEFQSGQEFIPGGAGQPIQPETALDPGYSDFYDSPDYEFTREQGERAIDRSLVARGKALSGQAVREGIRFAGGLATQNFNNYADRLASIAGIGQTSAAQNASVGAATAGQVGNAAMYGGAARASGYAAANNAVQGGLSNWLLMQQLAKRPNADPMTFNYSGARYDGYV